MGDCYFEQRIYKEGILYYEKAVELDQENIDAYFNLGAIYTFQAEHEKAIDLYRTHLRS